MIVVTGLPATRIDTKAAMNMKPPDYDQSIEPRQNMIQGNPQMLHNQHLNHGAYQPVPLAYNMQYTGLLPMVPGHYQVQAAGNGGVPSREETVEEKREKETATDQKKGPRRHLGLLP